MFATPTQPSYAHRVPSIAEPNPARLTPESETFETSLTPPTVPFIKPKAIIITIGISFAIVATT